MKHYRFVDHATQGYIALVAVLIACLHGERLAAWPWLLLAHAGGFALIHLLINVSVRFPAKRALGFLRDYYPILLFTAFYREVELLNRMLYSGYLDAHFLRLEWQLFGMQPGLELVRRLPSRWLAELLYAAYFSYYLMIGGVGLALLIRNRRQFAHFIAIVSFVFYSCYLTYIFVPVVGPRIVYRGLVEQPLPWEVIPVTDSLPPDSVQAALFYRIMGWIYDHFEAAGAAFPSSHVAVALCTVWFSFKYLRPIRYLHLCMAILLCISTVYGRYHYVVDVAAGIFAVGLLLPLGNQLYQKFGADEVQLLGGSEIESNAVPEVPSPASKR